MEAGNSLVPSLPPDHDPNPNSPRGGWEGPGDAKKALTIPYTYCAIMYRSY